ncbi:MAG TPA: VWA domain-containing protein [Amaricoccus sp.]|uniref:nitric oxide reductase activation protein NorD n=1 Tax=Amaricoccus sp. TaxID=1872485 RepID=UPI002C7BCF9D|nr:VWA domain-containing protein [Amaricoccus sp.]HRO10386.1 VWA domain-containing protein [Amaricoccus sp.]
MIRPLDLMEPEETVGNLWHDWASRGAAAGHAEAAVSFEAMRPSVAMLFRALGGPPQAEIVPVPAAVAGHRRGLEIGVRHEVVHVADFSGERLRLPPVIDAFPARALNRAAYLWLAGLAARVVIPGPEGDPCRADLAGIEALAVAGAEVLAACPGLVAAHAAMCRQLLAERGRVLLPRHEAAVEARVRALLGDAPAGEPPAARAPRGYRGVAPVPILLRLVPAGEGRGAAPDGEEGRAPALAMQTRKTAKREERDQANRRDSFIIHRFEAIMSWAESLNINRMTDDDDQENAQKAVDDQDHLTLSEHFRRAATRLRVSLDLSPQDAAHERLADRFTYPEWHHRARAHMPDHCRVLEVEAGEGGDFVPDHRLVARVRRQFAPLHPRRVMLSRQVDGSDLDLDAAVASEVDLRSGHNGSDRVWQDSRAVARDLSVAILMDCSRSTEAAVGETSVIDTAREALAALAAGIDSAGDRLGLWGFSSLRRDRVFVTRAKGFDEPMSPAVTARIGSLKPGHYTRLGAAIRHTTAMLAKETAARRLLLVLTDGKPNDLDHYEGVHGIEDSRMAVREARALGLAVHGVVVDADGQDWFARIFGRGGFTLLPYPARLPRALPAIYQTLTMES